MSPRRIQVADHCRGVLAGERRSVARAITLLESRRPDDVALAHELVERLVAHSGGAVRLGISGPPGVGKSTFIEALGLALTEAGERLAVLAIDPTSPKSGGSILGDKTRMAELAREERAFIRPSPSGGALGGVGHRTREAILICEAAGFGVVIVETVGVGQIEAEVASMVDFFALLLQPGAGDELQGIKRGALELADALVVTKADGDLRAQAERTQRDYGSALELLTPARDAWRTPVLLSSAARREGIREFWEVVLERRRQQTASGALQARRSAQARDWFRALVERELLAVLRRDPAAAAALPELERQVERHERSAPGAARELLELFSKSRAQGSVPARDSGL